MALFTIGGINAEGHRAMFTYDNMTSELRQLEGDAVDVTPFAKLSYKGAAAAMVVSADEPGRKGAPSVLKIQLGLLCNYECEYCNQRFQPKGDQTNHNHIGPFLDKLGKLDTNGLHTIEFWGGEPLVYWKTLRPLAAKLRAMYPKVKFSIITNGALLTREINMWLEAYGFTVAISHDGPAQAVRGPDPLEDKAQRANIIDLYRRLHPLGRISINTMMHRTNTSRVAVVKHLRTIFGDGVVVGEGAVIDPYDEGGMSMSFQDQAENIAFRRKAYNELASDPLMANMSITQRVREIVDSIANRRPAYVLGQKCSMDRPDHLAVDLNGNVLTCQNVSSKSTAPNGKMHNLGTVEALHEVRMRSSTHWSKRDECSKCPVLQSCKGSCMFLQGDLWEKGCDNAFSDHLPFFAAAIAYITGYMPQHIEGPQRADRKDIFGLLSIPEDRPKRKVFPIHPVA